MSLIKFRRNPWSSLTDSDFFDRDDFFNRLPGWSKRISEPALNIKDTDNSFEIELSAPGFTKDDFEDTINDGRLNVTAEKSSSKKEEEDNYPAIFISHFL